MELRRLINREAADYTAFRSTRQYFSALGQLVRGVIQKPRQWFHSSEFYFFSQEILSKKIRHYSFTSGIEILHRELFHAEHSFTVTDTFQFESTDGESNLPYRQQVSVDPVYIKTQKVHSLHADRLIRADTSRDCTVERGFVSASDHFSISITKGT